MGKHWGIVRIVVVLAILGALLTVPATASAWRNRYNSSYFKMTNTTDETVKVYLKYRHQPCRHCDFVTSSVKTKVLKPGQSAYLVVDGRRVKASRVRYWARSLVSSHKWTRYKYSDCWLIPRDYQGRRRTYASRRPTYHMKLRKGF